MAQPRRRSRPPLGARFGQWLRRVIKREQRTDRGWRREAEREQKGELGENIDPKTEPR